MFPTTGHVECVGLLALPRPSTHVEVCNRGVGMEKEKKNDDDVVAVSPKGLDTWRHMHTKQTLCHQYMHEDVIDLISLLLQLGSGKMPGRQRCSW